MPRWKKRKKKIWRKRRIAPPLTVEQILAWADAHHQRTGKWPKDRDGDIYDAAGETWRALDTALRVGVRTLPGGSSLARLLAKHRGVRNNKGLPPLTLEDILTWADAHYHRTGKWPQGKDGNIYDAAGETWLAMDKTLRHGRRGIPGGSSLAQLLAERRGVRMRNGAALPPLTPQDILAWADAHYRRTGKWPRETDREIHDAPGETWCAVNSSLRAGTRSLPGGSSLARLLSERRGVRNNRRLPPLIPDDILAWADTHHRRTGAWPTKSTEPVADAPGETWWAVDSALNNGQRGLPGGSTLRRFLREHGRGGSENPLRGQSLSIDTAK